MVYGKAPSGGLFGGWLVSKFEKKEIPEVEALHKNVTRYVKRILKLAKRHKKLTRKPAGPDGLPQKTQVEIIDLKDEAQKLVREVEENAIELAIVCDEVLKNLIAEGTYYDKGIDDAIAMDTLLTEEWNHTLHKALAEKHAERVERIRALKKDAA